MTDPTLRDFEQLCRWKSERRYCDLHLKLLGIELIRMDCCEYRLAEAAWAVETLARVFCCGERRK